MDIETKKNSFLAEIIEDLIDYALTNCNLENFEYDYSEDKNRLNGIQIALDSKGSEDSMRVDISIE